MQEALDAIFFACAPKVADGGAEKLVWRLYTAPYLTWYFGLGSSLRRWSISLALLPQPSHQCREPRAVLLSYGCKLQSPSLVRHPVHHHGVRSNLSFLHQKIYVNRSADRTNSSRVQKKPSEAEVAHLRNVIASFAIPTNPNILQVSNSEIKPSGRNSYPVNHGPAKAWA